MRLSRQEGFGLLDRDRSGERGWALPTVLAAILLLVAIAIGVASQVRSELRAAALEPGIAQGQTLVEAALNEVAQAARGNSTYGLSAPDPTKAPPSGWAPCVPIPVNAAEPNGPAYCTDLLKRTPRAVVYRTTPVTYDQIPVAVRWRLNRSETPRTTYAWVIIQPADVLVYYNQRWCRVKQPWDSTDFCEEGG